MRLSQVTYSIKSWFLREGFKYKSIFRPSSVSYKLLQNIVYNEKTNYRMGRNLKKKSDKRYIFNL